jgi:prepilin signal peptidase PulO-like enzyme (type II secretory pathway)
VSDALAGVVGLVLGVTVVGPLVVGAVLRWLGWRVTLPLLLGRVPSRREVGAPPVRCRRCGAPLTPLALPAVPSLITGTRCRACGEPLTRWYGLVEVTCGVLLGLAAAVVGWSAALVPVSVLVTGLVAVSVTDLVTMRIPTRFVRLTFGGLVIALVGVAVAEGPTDRLVGAVVGVVAFGGVLLVLHLVSPRSLGFGDVRLGALLGAAVGWSAWRADHPVLAPVQGVMVALLLAGLVGVAVGLVLLVVRRRDLPFPFGPALAIGGLAVFLSVVGGV